MRAIPNLVVIRPADANETVEAWKFALKHKDGPVALILTRQKIDVIDRKKYAPAGGLQKGAYIIKDSTANPDLLLIATGSEVSLAINAAEKLETGGKRIRVISFPSWEIFEQQDEAYKSYILPENIKARISVEMGIKMGWSKYVGITGKSLSIESFGASAPDNVLFEKFGFTTENLVDFANKEINKS